MSRFLPPSAYTIARASALLLGLCLLVGYREAGESSLAGSSTLTPLIALCAAMFVLDLFDLWLPHGDPVGVDGALAACVLVFSGPLAALCVSIVARGAAHVARNGLSLPRGFLLAAERRAIGLAVASATTYWIAFAMDQYGRAPLYAALAAAATTALLLSELLIAQLQALTAVERRFLALVAANVRFQLPLLAAQVSVAALVMITYEQMGAWSLLLMTVLLLLTRQSYAMLLEVRQAYRATIEALIDAAESQSPSRIGHAERTAQIARSIAGYLAVSSGLMERISYAALLHDIDMIGVDDGELRCAGTSTAKRSAGLLEDVGFLAEVVPMLRICDGRVCEADTWTEDEALGAFIVALASDVDCRAYPDVDDGRAIERVSPLIPLATKGKVIGAAVTLGYSIPELA